MFEPYLERLFVVLQTRVGAELLDVAPEADAVLSHGGDLDLLAAGRALGVLVLVFLCCREEFSGYLTVFSKYRVAHPLVGNI